MNDYIKREDAIKAMARGLGIPYTDFIDVAERCMDDIPTADVIEVVKCKDCKHRPIDTQKEGNGFDYEFPEEYGCPGYCDDGYYSQRFEDDFYCGWGERADT